MAKRVYHVPYSKTGNDICECGVDFGFHYVSHNPRGDPCEICKLATKNHKASKKETKKQKEVTYWGIDGEGQGKIDHRYTLLCAASEHGDFEYLEPKTDRLSTVECLDFLLSLPGKNVKLFTFSFNYDLTKILTDLDDESLYKLHHPDTRQRRGKFKALGPLPVEWKGYYLNLQGTKFTVKKNGVRRVVWDLFKFFQGKFIKAIQEWKVGDQALYDRIKRMKDARGTEGWEVKDPSEIRRYCMEECVCIGQLGRKLITAFESVDLQLTGFYGAGSAGGAMLKAMGIQGKNVQPIPEMLIPVFIAFSGGRFENSLLGPIEEYLDGWDISSAYPYAQTFLPCLEHASWKRTKKREYLDKAQNSCPKGPPVALVRYSLGPAKPGFTSWGPFPFRTPDGSISYPIESGGGWIWLSEYLAGEKIFPNIRFKEAWIYEKNCDCQPFAKIPEYYLLRLRIGKDGPGLAVKLAVNAGYGKLAQSIGNPVYNSWIWAGMITSQTRAQLLDLLGLHKNMANCLMMATDGLVTREKITPPEPIFTGTGIEIDGKKKPLGGWEQKDYKRGIFIARPGIYFPIKPTKEEVNEIRARGVGRSVLVKSWQIIVDAWNKDNIHGKAIIPGLERFCGAKSSISKSKAGYHRSPLYGQWTTRQTEMTFHPKPKRDSVMEDGRSLTLRRFPSDMMSAPYKRAVLSEEARELIAAKEEMLEQPDADLMAMDLGTLEYDDA